MKVKASKEMLAIVFLVVSGVVLVFAILITINLVAHKNDISVKAEVVKVYKEVPSGRAQKTGGALKYAIVSYNINGRDYEGEYRLGNFHGVSEGDIIDIKVNPADCSEIKNDFSFRAMIFYCVFFLLFDLFLFCAIKKVVKYENKF